ncbi:MAG: DUF4274 domain-containing protein [Methylophilaceae bacterium]
MDTTKKALIAAIETWAQTTLPSEYRQFLLSHDEMFFGDSILIYAAEDVIERNETYETKVYCPGYITIGDDSGGQAVVISLSGEPSSVFLVGHGHMKPDGFHLMANSLSEWIANGCPIIEQDQAEQDQYEAKSWQLIKMYLSSATPEKWHLFAARSNYDSNMKPLQWLIDNPALDRATALLIYWNLGAAWYVQYAAEDEALSAQKYRLLKLIETRYSAAYYQQSVIWFDPQHAVGGRPDDYPDIPVLQAIPSVMLAAVGTEYVEIDEDPEGFDEGLPYETVEALHALLDDV